MSSYADTDNKKKDILIIGEGPTQRLHCITLTVKENYSINFTLTSK